jgi:hypothetical protein
MSDEEHVYGRVPGRVYFSKEFVKKGASAKQARFAHRVFKEVDRTRFAMIKDEVVLRTSFGDRYQLKALFDVDDRSIDTLHLQTFTRETGVPHKNFDYCLYADEIDALVEFVMRIRSEQFSDGTKVRIDEEQLGNYRLTDAAAKLLLSGNAHLLADLAAQMATEDIIAIAYRREQLKVFSRLLSDSEFFESQRKETGASGPEAVWQAFFERNPWIFGYGLFFVFTTGFDPSRLEQVVAGQNISSSGKRADALMQTQGLIKSLCFVEIKTPQTPLLRTTPPRPGTWAISADVAEAVAQSQMTVQRAQEQLHERIFGKDDEGNPTGGTAFLLRPRSVLLVGHLKEFISAHGVNESKFTSFELFRRQLGSPEMLTFDELYERAKFIVEHRA